jgi:hypothetical protein
LLIIEYNLTPGCVRLLNHQQDKSPFGTAINIYKIRFY